MSTGPDTVITEIVEQAYASLVSEAGYPDLPQELSPTFLIGVDPTALTQDECEALAKAYAADLRLTALLDQLLVAVTLRKGEILVRDKSLFALIGTRTGHKSFAESHGVTSGIGERAAAREVAAAETLATNEHALRAVDSGAFTMGHVGVLASATATQERLGTKALTPAEEAELVEMGKARTAEQYAGDVARYLNGRDPVAHDAAIEEQRRRRYFNIAYKNQGAYLSGYLDSGAAQVLKAAMTAASPKPAADDDRSFSQCNADALVTIASTALDGGGMKPGAAVRPHVTLVMSEATFVEGTRELRRRQLVRAHNLLPSTALPRGSRNSAQVGGSTESAGGASTAGTAGTPGTAGTAGNTGTVDITGTTDAARNSDAHLDGPETANVAPLDPSLLVPIPVTPAQYEDGTPIPLNDLARLLCDARITRVVLDAQGLVTNLGRTARVYTKEHRYSVIARDGGCVFAGCSTSPSKCEVHHIEWWDEDLGDTSLENAALLCQYHHIQIHSGILKIVKDHFGLPHAVPMAQSSMTQTSLTAPRLHRLGSPHQACPTTGPAAPERSSASPSIPESPTIELSISKDCALSRNEIVHPASEPPAPEHSAMENPGLELPTSNLATATKSSARRFGSARGSTSAQKSARNRKKGERAFDLFESST